MCGAGNDEPKASLPGEYVVYDESGAVSRLHEKYTNTGNVSFVVPAPLSKSMTTKIQRMAIRRFSRLMARDWRESISFCRATAANWW
jgi:D-alanine-D-alanine ligase-like ATP-grasp enzyme